MKNRNRYGLIVIGVCIFSFTVPIILRQLSGVVLVDEEKQNTGIITVKTDPEANVYLNDQLIGTSPTDKSFLAPDIYKVRIEKDNYNTWTKDLKVTGGMVTWINPEPIKLHLFLKTQKEEVSEKPLDFLLQDNEQYYGFYDNTLNFPFNTTKVNSSVSYIEKPKLQNNILVTQKDKQTTLYTTAGEKILEIPKTPSQYQIHRQDIYYIDKDTLIHNSQGNESIIDGKVKTFGIFGEDIYYIKDNQVIRYSPIDKQKITINENAPCQDRCSIYVSKNKKVFIENRQNLYKLELDWKKITSEIQKIYFDYDNSELVYVSLNEVSFYDFNSDKEWLIDRSSQGDTVNKKYIFRGDIGYIFYSQENKVNLLEIDRRGVQNKYEYTFDDTIKDFYLNKSADTLVVLTNKSLTKNKIR